MISRSNLFLLLGPDPLLCLCLTHDLDYGLSPYPYPTLYLFLSLYPVPYLYPVGLSTTGATFTQWGLQCLQQE